MKKKLIIILILVSFLQMSVLGVALGKGVIKGNLKDIQTGEPLFGVNIFIPNTSIGASSDFDGNFSFEVPSGTYTVRMTLLSYKEQEFANIVVKEGQTIELNKTMGEDSQMLGEVTVVASARKESQKALLVEQKNATVIRESIGAEQLSSQGVSNAAGATTKLAGVTKTDGANRVYVRGLGDRYTTTRLNGLPLPSNNPKMKNIALTLFPSGIIQNIGVSKTFSAKESGDVAGADIDIKTREISGKSVLNIGFSVGANSQTTGKEFSTIEGTNRWGFAKEVEHPVSDLKKYPFSPRISPESSKGKPVLSLSIDGGRRFDVGEEGSLSAFFVGLVNNDYGYNDGFQIDRYTKTGVGASFPTAREFKYKATKLAMGNFVYRINNQHKISYTSLFVHSNNQDIKDYYGTKPDIAEGTDGKFTKIVLQKENQNKLFVNQLFSEHKIGETIDLNLSLAYNKIINDEPNRKKNIYIIDTNTDTRGFATGTPHNNNRYYHNMEEDDLFARFSIVKYFGSRNSDESKGKIQLGYEYRNTDRRMDYIYFDHDFTKVKPVLKNAGDEDKVFTQPNLDKKLFRVVTGYGFSDNALNPFYYTGEKVNHTIYGVLDYDLTDKLSMSLGARMEQVNMTVGWMTNITNSDENGDRKLDETYFLPSMNLKYELNDRHQFRFAASKTYTYPQFKEIAPFLYEDINHTEEGNPNLKPSDNYNIDLKWEWFLSRNGLFSVAVFGKYIEDAINKVEDISAGENHYYFFNTGDAKVYGVEIEMKRDLYSFSDEGADYTSKLMGGLNAAYMTATQKFHKIDRFDPTKQEESLEGAAPFVFNADLSYQFSENDRKTIASIVLNYQHDKLYAVGTENLESVIQKPTAKLDFIFKHSFNKHWGVKLGLKNILNTDFEKYRGERDVDEVLVISSYKKGLDASLGVTYKF